MEDNNLRPTFYEGQLVWLDKKFHNCSQVVVISQTPKKLYTTVKALDRDSTWDVMSYRLTV